VLLSHALDGVLPTHVQERSQLPSHVGLVMPVGDVASLSQNLGFLWDDNETGRLLSMGARERVEQAFSLQTLVLSFTSSLENEVLSRHQPVRQFVNDAGVEGHTLS
jgi:glycosyltransferase involved in cell wall biosynthesis